MDDLEIRRISEILKESSQLEGVRKYFQFFFGVILNLSVLYALATLAFALAGLRSHYFYFSFHLLEVIISQTVLVNVLYSVANPISQLFFIYTFFIVLMYFFALLIYKFMYQDMPNGSCESLLICLATLYTQTFTVIH